MKHGFQICKKTPNVPNAPNDALKPLFYIIKRKKTIKQYRWIRWDNPLFRWAKAKKGVLLGALGGLGDKIAPTKYN